MEIMSLCGCNDYANFIHLFSSLEVRAKTAFDDTHIYMTMAVVLVMIVEWAEDRITAVNVYVWMVLRVALLTQIHNARLCIVHAS